VEINKEEFNAAGASQFHRKSSLRTVPRYFQWERGGLDAHGMMTGDDTGGDVWTVAGAW
jgi:hypothetical protein